MQNFDSLASGLPNGWAVVTGATTTATGSNVSSSYFDANPADSANTWTSTALEYKNLASYLSLLITNPTVAQQTSCTNRALGIRQASPQTDPGGAFVLTIANTTGFDGFNLAFDFQMLQENPRSMTWTVDYRVGGTGSFTPVGTIPDPGAVGDYPQSFSFGTALDNQSGMVEIRVAALTASTGSGNRDVMAIDNFNLTYTSMAPTNFADIFRVTNTVGNVQLGSWNGAVTNYLDQGAATNWPTSFYRVRLVP
jgi:hypothetical protein